MRLSECVKGWTKSGKARAGRVLRRCGVAALGGCVSLCGLAQSAPQAATVAERLGYAREARLLVIQADDLGMAHSIDKASFAALEKGWVTTAGVLAPGPWFPEVARWARKHPQADLGLQLDLTGDWTSYRWRPVTGITQESHLLDQGGYLVSSDQYAAVHGDPAAIEREVTAQWQLAQTAGLSVSYLDEHMNTLVLKPVLAQIFLKLGATAHVPVEIPSQYIRMRGTPGQTAEQYRFADMDVNLADFPIQQKLEMKPGIAKQDWLSAYEKTLADLPPGVYLLSVHLGYDDEELEAMTVDHPNWGAQWRQNDLDVVSSAEFQKFLKDKGFVLVNWKDLRKAMPEHP